MLRKKSGDADMTQGVIWKQLLEFSIPMMLGLLFQQLYNTVDTVVVGHFVGKSALAAVGCTGSIINMLVGLCTGLSAGAGVVISQRYGAHDDEGLHDAVHTSITLTLLLSAAATVIGVLIVSPMLRMMQTPDDVFAEAEEYLTIYFAGIVGLLIYNMGSGILRAVGDSRRPLYFLCFSAGVNVVGDLVFVIVFDLGVAGVAYATILSQLLSALLVLFVLARTDAPYKLIFSHLRIRRTTLKNILALGLPSSIQQALTSFSNVFVQSYINSFGTACMGGWTSYNKLDVFILIPVQSIALASTTFVGQNCGAQNYPRARRGVRQALFMSLICTALITVPVVIFRKQFLWLFSPDETIVAYGARFVMLISPFYLTICFNQIFAGALRGIGNARMPMFIMLFSFVVFRQIYLFLNQQLLDNSFVLTALAYPAGWVMCSILLFFCYRRSALCRTVEVTAEIPETV